MAKFALLALALAASALSARANIYATNIRLAGNTNNLVFPLGNTVTISYILNEPALLGVELDILAGTNVVRTFNLAGDGPGAVSGLNQIDWDAKDNNSNYVAAGTYSVRITAASSGYTNWNQISDDANTNTYVYDGHGIAVDRNPASLYYGRILVANSTSGPDPTDTPGDRLGVLKLNADGSAADEGISSDVDWFGMGFMPGKVEVSDDDQVYVNDLAARGAVYRWDPLLSTNSQLYVLRQDNVTNRLFLTSQFISGSGTNTRIWAANWTNQGNVGVLKWKVGANGACASNDLGTLVVARGLDLDQATYDVALDNAGNIYACQHIDASGSLSPRILRFAAYDPATNGGAPELAASWTIGSNDDNYCQASGIAVDPTGTYVGVACQGLDSVGFLLHGNTRILYATNGALAADLDLDVPVNGDPTHQDTDCAWDAVGNVYYIDNWLGHWRVFSPPGTNQSTTVGALNFVVPPFPPPRITNITVISSTVLITFTALPGEAASAFVVLSASDVTGPYVLAAGVTITNVSSGVYRAIVPASGSMKYYKVMRQAALPVQAPLITNMGSAAGTVTLNFTGASYDPPSAFTVLSAPDVRGAYSNAPGASITSLGAGSFRATVPAGGPMQFYRIRR